MKVQKLLTGQDTLADFTEAKASIVAGELTMGVAHAIPAVGKAHRPIVLSEGTAKDATFARQVRRKFV